MTTDEKTTLSTLPDHQRIRMAMNHDSEPGYRRLLALIVASTVDASASSRMAVLATSLYLLGVVIVCAAGQRIMIKLGLLPPHARARSQKRVAD